MSMLERRLRQGLGAVLAVVSLGHATVARAQAEAAPVGEPQQPLPAPPTPELPPAAQPGSERPVHPQPSPSQPGSEPTTHVLPPAPADSSAQPQASVPALPAPAGSSAALSHSAPLSLSAPRDPARGGRPRVGAVPLTHSGVVLEQQTVEVSCRGRQRLVCRVENTQRLANPDMASLVVDIELPGNVQDARWEGKAIEPATNGGDTQSVVGVVQLTLAPRSHGTLYSLHEFEVRLSTQQATRARHPTLGGNLGDGERADLSFDLGPQEGWARVGRRDVSVNLPAGWRVRAATATPLQPLGARGALVDACDSTAPSRSSLCDGRIPLEIENPGRRFLSNGGPVLGMTIPTRGPARARMGYEAGLGQLWLLTVLGGVASETEQRGNLLMVPTLTASAPRFGYVPAFALALSAPVRVGRDNAVAFRADLNIVQPIGPVSVMLSPGYEYFSVDKKSTFLMGFQLGL